MNKEMIKAIEWWNKQSPTNKLTFEHKLFGYGDYSEFNELTNKDILKLYLEFGK